MSCASASLRAVARMVSEVASAWLIRPGRARERHDVLGHFPGVDAAAVRAGAQRQQRRARTAGR